MKAKDWIMRYGLKHYAKYNLRKDGKRGRELDDELIRTYRKRYGAEIPIKPPRKYYYAIWDFEFSYYSKAEGREKWDQISDCKSVLRSWDDLRENREEELLENEEQTFDALRRDRTIPYESELESSELIKIKQIIQRQLEDYEAEVEKEKVEIEKKEDLPEPEPIPEKAIEPSIKERELSLKEREIAVKERELSIKERKLKLAEKFLEKGYSPKEIKELIEAI